MIKIALIDVCIPDNLAAGIQVNWVGNFGDVEYTSIDRLINFATNENDLNVMEDDCYYLRFLNRAYFWKGKVIGFYTDDGTPIFYLAKEF